MDIIEIIKEQLAGTVKELLKNSSNSEESSEKQLKFAVEFAKRKEFGDLSTNIALVLVKPMKQPLLEIAKKIIEALLKKSDIIKKAELLNGFINISLQDNIWEKLLKTINQEEENFGCENIGKGEKTHIEFVSANPTGPLHLGHIRGAIIFDTLAEVFSKLGFNVIREYYINDAGGQIETLLKSIFWRYKELINNINIINNNEDLKKQIEQSAGAKQGEAPCPILPKTSPKVFESLVEEDFPKDCYPGEYIKDFAKELLASHGETLANVDFLTFKKEVKELAITNMMALIKADLVKLKIHYDIFTSEAELHRNGYLEKSLKLLETKKFLCRETLPEPKNPEEDWEPREQLVFLAKNFGDNENRSLQKSDGSYTYFASDLGYHLYKIERGFSYMIIGLGADHAGYIKRLKAAVSALSSNKARIDIKLYNIVNLFNNGEPVKLSKRKGNILSLSDLIEKNISPEEIRFAMLTRSSETVLDFDIAKFIEDSYDNPIFYVQYASARAASVLRKYNALNKDANQEINNCNIALLKYTEERELIRILAKWPSILKAVVLDYEVHKIIFYLQEVAEKFHSLWNLGMKDYNFKFIIEGEKEITESRLFLVLAAKKVIKAGLSILKITQVEKM